MKTNNKVVRLTESDLHNIISESVKSILNEIGDTPYGQYMLGRASARAKKYSDYRAHELWNHARDANSHNVGRGSFDDTDFQKNKDAFKNGYYNQDDYMNVVDNNDVNNTEWAAKRIKNNSNQYHQDIPRTSRKLSTSMRDSVRNKYKIN